MIEIRVTADNMDDALCQLTGLAVNVDQPLQNETQDPLNLIDDTPVTCKAKPAKTEKAPSAEGITPKEDTEKQSNETPIPDVVALRAAATEKANTPEGKAAIKELLKKYDSKSISTIPEDKRMSFLKDVEAL